MEYSVFTSVLDGVKPSCPVLDGHRLPLLGDRRPVAAFVA